MKNQEPTKNMTSRAYHWLLLSDLPKHFMNKEDNPEELDDSDFLKDLIG